MLRKVLQYSFGAINKPQRNSNFRKIDQSDLEFFKGFMSENQVKTSDLEPFNTDWMNKYFGNSELVLFPKTTEQVQKIVQYCNEKMIPIVPQSGNTGLVGGSIPVHDEVILNLQKMNKIINFDENSKILNTECGVILEAANSYISQFNCEIPWDLGAKGSCFLGGNVATAAGGKYFVKYGSLKGYILGMEVVTGNGEVLNLESCVRKDNTGMDMKQFFIGSEGSLGIITKLNILCSPIDSNKNLFLLNCSNYKTVLDIHRLAKEKLGANLAAIEWMDGYSYQRFFDKLGSVTSIENPFSSENDPENDYYVVLEMNSNHEIQDLQDEFFEPIFELEGFKDCIVAENDSQFREIWEIRESIQMAAGIDAESQFKYDISLNINHMDEITKALREKVENYDSYVVGYGHIGDSNLHVNVVVNKAEEQEQMEKVLEPFIFEYVQKVKGSISAEHGIGVMKSKYMPLQKSPETLDYMRQIKQVFDKKGILNPYKIFP